MSNMILFVEWKSFGNRWLKEAFQSQGYIIDSLPLDTKQVDTRLDAEYTEKLVRTIMEKSYYFVFSFNYFPIVAMACKACRIPYVSWTYDSPFIQLYSKTLTYETNIPFVFDMGTCRDLTAKGMTTYYLPMAAPMDCYQSVLKDTRKNQAYAGDISFVGSLYNEPDGNIFRHMEKLAPYERGYIDALINAQKNVYGYNFLQKILEEKPQIIEKIREVCPIYARPDGEETAEWTLANYFLARKVTSLERIEIMKLLGEQFGINLYTHEPTDMKGVRNLGKVDYYKDAPYVFANSKINLNISLRSIQTGIPLRAFDIMGCGGFLLTNYQEDYLEYFEPDEDIVIYYGYEDLVEKVAFYLQNEQERERIARNGYEKVAAEHTYLQRSEVILAAVREYWG